MSNETKNECLEQCQSLLRECSERLQRIEAAESAGDYETADSEREAAQNELLEVIYLSDQVGNGYTYRELIFTIGGPHLCAVRGPHDTHYHIICDWLPETAEIEDIDDVLRRLYPINDDQ